MTQKERIGDKSERILCAIMVCLWMGFWIGAIWCDSLRWKLFFSGCLCLAVALAYYTQESK